MTHTSATRIALLEVLLFFAAGPPSRRFAASGDYSTAAQLGFPVSVQRWPIVLGGLKKGGGAGGGRQSQRPAGRLRLSLWISASLCCGRRKEFCVLVGWPSTSRAVALTTGFARPSGLRVELAPCVRQVDDFARKEIGPDYAHDSGSWFSSCSGLLDYLGFSGRECFQRRGGPRPELGIS